MDVLVQLALLMAKLGILSFGGGNVALAELQREVVGRGWLTEAQFVDSYAIGQMSPGPGTLFVVPIGYLAAGVPGAVVATVAFFAPPAVVTLLVAVVWTRFRENPWPKAMRTGLLPIVAGLSFAAAVAMARAAIPDIASALIAGAAMLVFWRTSFPAPVVLLGAAAVGAVVLQPATESPAATAAPPSRSAWAWGANDWGQVGDRPVQVSSIPIRVVVDSPPVGVAGGTSHSLALDETGAVWAWGNNRYGQLGDGGTQNRSRPSRVVGLDGAIGIAAGSYHSLALQRDGTVWAWGFNGTSQAGTSADMVQPTPVRVEGLSGVVAICAGATHNLAVDASGAVWAWGSNRYGELGNGSFITQAEPERVWVVAVPVAAVACGQQHSLAVGTDGSVWSWGANRAGQLGSAPSDPHPFPQRVPGVPHVVAAAAGLQHSLALTRSGAVWSWGRDGLQRDEGAASWAPREALVGGRSIAATLYESLVVKHDGAVWGWGSPSVGLGLPRFPGPIVALDDVVAVSGGASHLLAIQRGR